MDVMMWRGGLGEGVSEQYQTQNAEGHGRALKTTVGHRCRFERSYSPAG